MINSLSFPLSECSTENNIAYKGYEVNNGLQEKQPDVSSCRQHCKNKNAPFFEYILPNTNYGEEYYRGSCWCKTSNSGRVPQTGSVSGGTSCPLGKNVTTHHTLSKASKASLGQWREFRLLVTYRLRDGWTNRAETWWDGRRHAGERPREEIFLIR